MGFLFSHTGRDGGKANMTKTNDIIEITETDVEPATFMVWQLAALYRKLGLVAHEAERAARADLRMFVPQPREPQYQIS